MNERFFEIWIGDADTPSKLGGAKGKDFRDACIAVCREVPGFNAQALMINNMLLYDNADQAQADWDYRNLAPEAPSGLEAGEVGI